MSASTPRARTRSSWQRSDERQLELVPDRKIYAPGDTAHLLIKSPLARGTYLVSVERDGVLEKRTLDLAGSAPTIDVKITEDHVPMVYVFVAVSTGRTAPPADGPDAPDFGKPRGYSGLAEIPVTTASRTITVQISNSKDSYLPGTDATVTLKAVLNGQPLPGRRSRSSPRTGASWISSTIAFPIPLTSSTAGATFPTGWRISIRAIS